MPKIYKILRMGEEVRLVVPGKYAGYRKNKIFGRLDCLAGKKMHKKNRVFFGD